MNNGSVGSDSTPSVTADVFEAGSGVPAALTRLGAEVVVEALPAGDYLIQGGVLVERKTVPDLHASLGSGRLWHQIGRIRDEAAWPILLVEGDRLDTGPRHPNAIRGALLAVADLGVTLLWSRGPADSARWLHRLAIRQARKRNGRTARPASTRTPDPAVTLLCAVPGISAHTAEALLQRFGSVSSLIDAGPTRWSDVAGVGSVRAHALATALLSEPRRDLDRGKGTEGVGAATNVP